MTGPKVAFSASLAASGEIYQEHSDASPNLVYKRIFTNTGNAYDSKTGNVPYMTYSVLTVNY